MAAVLMCTAFMAAARWLDPESLFREDGFAQLTIPPAIILITIILADAYSDPKERSPLKPLFGPALGLALAYAVELNHRSALSASVLALGGTLSVLFVSTLRLMFLPITERLRVAKAPAFWQKLELLPPPFSLKSALLSSAVLLAIVLCLLILRG